MYSCYLLRYLFWRYRLPPSSVWARMCGFVSLALVLSVSNQRDYSEVTLFIQSIMSSAWGHTPFCAYCVAKRDWKWPSGRGRWWLEWWPLFSSSRSTFKQHKVLMSNIKTQMFVSACAFGALWAAWRFALFVMRQKKEPKTCASG